MNELQTLIDAAADKKLDKDIDSFIALLQSNTYNNLFADFIIQVPDATDRKVQLQYFCSESKIKQYLRAKAIPRYREQEAKLFMKKVERLSQNVDSLKGDIDNLLNNEE